MFRLRLHLALAYLLLFCAAAQGQDPPVKPSKTNWSFSASVDMYIIPNDRDYPQPTFVAERGWLHLEARYNYESFETGSLWIGYNLFAGKKLSLVLTPMISAVLGKTAGVAPGYEFLVTWRKLELYSEGEWVFNLRDRSDSFYFAWSELTLAPVDWLSFGIVGQRTRVFNAERDIQRGVLLRLLLKRLELTGHVFNPERNPQYVFSLAVDF